MLLVCYRPVATMEDKLQETLKKVRGAGDSGSKDKCSGSTRERYTSIYPLNLSAVVRSADLMLILGTFPGFAALTPGFTPSSAPRTPTAGPPSHDIQVERLNQSFLMFAPSKSLKAKAWATSTAGPAY